MVSDEKQYEFVSGQVRYYNEKIIESVEFFIKIFSAIAGGSIWLSMQKLPIDKMSTYQTLSNTIVIVAAAVAVVRVIENLRSWRGYRNAQCRLEPTIPRPRLVKASVSEAIMVLGIVTTAVLFVRFNPFVG